VAHAHVDRAVARLLAGENAPNFDPSRDFDLLAPEGERLAPKKVFGLALEEALGIEARPEHFSAGLGTVCFQILEAAGYPIIRKDEGVLGGGMEPVDPDLEAAEGERRLVAHLRRERKPALAAAKRRAMIAQLGYLQCERCRLIPSRTLGLYGDAVIEVHHAGTQLAEMAAGHTTRLGDLMCLCANCHRLVHREMKGRSAAPNA
jgi:5-methylcytosine-specific restriction protein A